MIIDDVIWEVINNGHCAFKTKTVTNTFCNNPYNLTGQCNRNSCPLANSRYATVLEEKGVCYLTMKTAERAHTPNELWEKIKLDKSYNKAIAEIDENLEYWPEFLKHKSKQRFTRIRQMLIKKRKMKMEGRKAEKREKSRLQKAEKAALIDKHIEEELLKNLQSGKYNDIWNVSQKNWEKVLEKQALETEKEEEFDSEDIDNVFVGDLYGADENEDDEESFADDSKLNDSNATKKTNNTSNISDKKFTSKKRTRGDKDGKGKKGKFNLEYEYENKEKNVEHNYDW